MRYLLQGHITVASLPAGHLASVVFSLIVSRAAVPQYLLLQLEVEVAASATLKRMHKTSNPF